MVVLCSQMLLCPSLYALYVYLHVILHIVCVTVLIDDEHQI